MKKLIISCTLLLSFVLLQAGPLSIKLASYNLRYENKGDSLKGNGWQQRLPVIANQVHYHDFDLMGTQECKFNQVDGLLQALPDYSFIGGGRDDGKRGGESSVIFYKKDKFVLLSQGDFWLSETPDVPSKGWDAALNRICTWGKFKEKESGKEFYYFNLHMDHRGKEARRQSARLLLQKVQEIAGPKAAVVVSGDFNVDQFNESYVLINTSEQLTDSYDLAKVRYEPNGTFNNFKPNLKTKSRIDHIFVSKQFTVDRYGILPEVYWGPTPVDEEETKAGAAPQEISFQKFEARMPSDHFPVVVTLEYK